MSAIKDRPKQSRFQLTPDQAEIIRRSPSANLTVPEAAIYIGVSLRTLWEWISQRKIKVVRLGGRTILRLRDIEEFLERRSV